MKVKLKMPVKIVMDAQVPDENRNRMVTTARAQSTYVIFAKNARLYIGRGEETGGVCGIEPLVPATIKSISAGSKIVIRKRGMTRVQVASVIKIISGRPRSTLKLYQSKNDALHKQRIAIER